MMGDGWLMQIEGPPHTKERNQASMHPRSTLDRDRTTTGKHTTTPTSSALLTRHQQPNAKHQPTNHGHPRQLQQHPGRGPRRRQPRHRAPGPRGSSCPVAHAAYPGAPLRQGSRLTGRSPAGAPGPASARGGRGGQHREPRPLPAGQRRNVRGAHAAPCSPIIATRCLLCVVIAGLSN